MSHLTLEVPPGPKLNLQSVQSVLGQPNWYSAQSLFTLHPFTWDLEHPENLDLQQIRSHREAEPEEMLRHCGGFTRSGTWHLWGREETHQRGAVFARVPCRY